MTTATITSTKGTHTGTVAECLTWQMQTRGAFADLRVGAHTLRLDDARMVCNEDPCDVDDCRVRPNDGLELDETSIGQITRVSASKVVVRFDDGCESFDIEVLANGMLLPV